MGIVVYGCVDGLINSIEFVGNSFYAIKPSFTLSNMPMNGRLCSHKISSKVHGSSKWVYS